LRSWVLGAFIGDVPFQVDPTTIGNLPGVLIRGTALAGRVEIAAELGTQAPYPVRLEIKTRRLELDPFIDLGKRLGIPEPVEAWMTGTVTVTTELAPLSGKPAVPDAWVEIQELAATVDRRARDGRQTPLRFALVPPDENGRFAMSL